MLSCLILLGHLALGPSAASDVVLGGLDPIALASGVESSGLAELEVVHGRFTYRFADQANRDRFAAEPERWAVQWGGACGRMGPLSGLGSPDRWLVHDGRIWLFASDGCREGFLSAPERFAVTAQPLPQLDPERVARGIRWMERATRAHGGADAIAAAGSLHLGASKTADGWTVARELRLTSDAGLRRKSAWTKGDDAQPTWDSVWEIEAEAYVLEEGERFSITSPDLLGDLRRVAHREPLAHLWAQGSEDFLILDLGPGELAGSAVENVLVHHDDLSTTLHLDSESARIVGLSWTGRLDSGLTTRQVETFSDWREVSGVLIPMGHSVTIDGEPRPSSAVLWNEVARERREPLAREDSSR